MFHYPKASTMEKNATEETEKGRDKKLHGLVAKFHHDSTSTGFAC